MWPLELLAYTIILSFGLLLLVPLWWATKELIGLSAAWWRGRGRP
jgi:hypothetical protein